MWVDQERRLRQRAASIRATHRMKETVLVYLKRAIRVAATVAATRNFLIHSLDLDPRISSGQKVATLAAHMLRRPCLWLARRWVGDLQPADLTELIERDQRRIVGGEERIEVTG